MSTSLSPDAKYRIYVALLCTIACALIIITTSKYGAGVSSDAARNLSTADSLLEGKGFVDMLGAPLLLWPPLYPLLIAGLSWLSGWGTFQTAWYLNGALFVLNTWLAGSYLYQVFRNRAILAYVGSIVVLLSRSVLRIHANVASEPLFESFTLAFFILAGVFLQSGSATTLWSLFILAGLATLQRYLGVVLIGVAVVVVLIRDRWPGIRRCVLPFLVSVIPIGAWALLHNYPLSGTLFGPRDLGAMYPLLNIELSLTKILWWFIPRIGPLDFLVLHPWIPLIGVAVVLGAINRRPDWHSWINDLTNVFLWPAVLFSVVYFFLLAFTVVTADHLDLTSDRYYVVILPVAVACILVTLDRLVVPHVALKPTLRQALLGAAILLWLTYPTYSLQSYLRQALVQGEPTNYNIANSANFREMSVVKAGQGILAADPSGLVYSNYVNIVWFIYHHPVQALPFENAGLPRAQRVIALKANYPDWPQQGGYIIWFTPNQYHHIVAPDELATLVSLQLLYADDTGQIYHVAAKSP